MKIYIYQCENSNHNRLGEEVIKAALFVDKQIIYMMHPIFVDIPDPRIRCPPSLPGQRRDFNQHLFLNLLTTIAPRDLTTAPIRGYSAPVVNCHMQPAILTWRTSNCWAAW